MERVFFCGECRKFFFEECDETVYSCKCKHCESETTIACNLGRDDYDKYSDEEKNSFKRNIKFKYPNAESITAEHKRIIAEREHEEAERIKMLEINKIKVTTGDLKQNYEIIGPVYYQINNRGLLTNEIDRKSVEYRKELELMKKSQLLSQNRSDWGWVYGNFSIGETYFERAFFIATQELKKRAYILGADAVICMRQDIDIETEHLNNFYLQMYGTAVKII